MEILVIKKIQTIKNFEREQLEKFLGVKTRKVAFSEFTFPKIDKYSQERNSHFRGP